MSGSSGDLYNEIRPPHMRISEFRAEQLLKQLAISLLDEEDQQHFVVDSISENDAGDYVIHFKPKGHKGRYNEKDYYYGEKTPRLRLDDQGRIVDVGEENPKHPDRV